MQIRNVSLLLVSLLMALALAGAAMAQLPTLEGDSSPRVLEKVIRLHPESREHRERVRELYALVWSDGSVGLSGRGRAQVGAPPELFEIEANAMEGTYRTREASPTELQLESEPWPGPQAEGGVVPGLGTKATVSGYRATVRLYTKDPALISLTKTEISLDWWSCNHESVNLTDKWNNCWAANPSVLGTHWFVSSCQTWPADDLFDGVCGDSEGRYYNYDFGFDNQRTNVYQIVTLCGYSSGSYDYWFDHNDSGEFSDLIFGWVSTSSGAGTPGTCAGGGGGGGGGGDGGDGGSGGDGGGSGGGGGTCVPVYDGNSGDHLGDCCGDTTAEIVECAAQYL